MTLPRSRHETYQDSSTPSPDEVFFNGVQDAHIDRYFQRELVCDDFLGDSLDRGQWKNVTLVGAGATSIVDDSANGGSGVYKFDVNNAGAAAAILETQPIVVGSDDFYFRARVKTTGVTAKTTFVLGFDSKVGFWLDGSGSTTNWKLLINGLAVSPTSAIAVSTSYQLFEIERISGVTRFYVDGVEVHQTSTAIAISANALKIDTSNTNGIGGLGGFLWVDSFEAWKYYF